MTSNLTEYIPKPRNWFEENVVYEGLGRAEFSDPQGWVEGDVHIEFNTIGEAKIEMKVRAFHNTYNPQGEYAIEELLSGQKPENQPVSSWHMSFPSQRNECTSFVVETDDWKFTAVGKIDFEHFFMPQSGTLPFFISQSNFIIKNASEPKYWVMPLCNFVSNLGLRYRDLNDHPLRLYEIPRIPPDLPEEHIKVANWNSQSRNFLIVFEYKNRIGFIEALHDYKSREEALKSGDIPYSITALMNCEISEEVEDIRQLWNWFPIQFLDLLSLATGSRVSAPWIEFHDERGNLVSRVHTPQWSRRYVTGHIVIDDHIHHGIGQLLTNASLSQYFRDKAMTDVIEQLILSTQGVSLGLADRLAHLCRAIDTLCEEQGLYETTRLNDFLDEQQTKAVKQAIKDAVTDVDIILETLRKSGKNHEVKLLEKVINALNDAKTIRSGFGVVVYGLLQKYNLPDAQILDEHFASNPILDNKNNKLKKWGIILAHFRGKVIHHISYFNIDDDQWKDVERITKHLHDVIVRIVLKMLNYAGKYQPIIKRYPTDDYSIDWVTSDTKPDQLGFK